jgi:transitional endoplasmic reticulum ATPase
MLDPALLRSGRFDRLIMVPIPDRDTRLKILRVHTKSVPMKDVNLEALADQLDGFTGADIEGLVREAAMIALREDMATGSVTKTHFEEAKKVIKPSGGPDVVKYYEAVRKKIEGGMGKMSKEDSPAGYW